MTGHGSSSMFRSCTAGAGSAVLPAIFVSTYLPDLSIASDKRIAWIHSPLLEVGSGSASSAGALADRAAACAAVLHTRALEERKSAKTSAGSLDVGAYEQKPIPRRLNQAGR